MKITVELNLRQLQILYVLLMTHVKILESKLRSADSPPGDQLSFCRELLSHLARKRGKLFQVKTSNCGPCNKHQGTSDGGSPYRTTGTSAGADSVYE